MSAYYMPSHSDRYVFHADHVADPSTFRPVVVIDLEDREQVERLSMAYAATVSARLGDEYLAWENRSAEARQRIVVDLQAALREFAKPPKPAEPTVGALVEDEGVEWAHLNTPKAPWHSLDGKGRWATWDDFSAAVRVLSEGVTA